MTKGIRLRRRGSSFVLGSLLFGLSGTMILNSCLNRPVTPSEPETTNLFVDQVRTERIDKIDLLFVVDNSVSMADKQRLLSRAVPNLLRRVVHPPCVDRETGAFEPSDFSADLPCPRGLELEFPAVDDIHIGVITSSLGTQGGGSCSSKGGDDDHARLVPSIRTGVPSWNSSGFLVWDPKSKHSPAGHRDIDALLDDFQATVDAVGENGCGFESTLEAWYRFLVDPEPPLDVRFDAGAKVAVREGVDAELLAQRARFLRPDSLVGIIMLSDEDDCSIGEQSYSWLMSNEDWRRPRATSACASDTLSPCCRPCTSQETAPPSGCSSIADDPACAVKDYPAEAAEDTRNQRCAEQKRKYGLEFLHPVGRYVSALTEPVIANRAGELVRNPLFAAPPGAQPRDQSRLFLAGILGVPWQDVASKESLATSSLSYLSYDELEREGRWPLILGDPTHADPARRRPLDPLLWVTSDPRSGSHPLLGVSLAPPTSTNPRENPINGHEYHNLGNVDLQYSCIFELEKPLPCTGDVNCDCVAPDDLKRNRPLCQPPAGGPAESTQYFAKAYPAPRHLQVLSGLRENGVVASICPKVASGDAADPSYGYNPALGYVARILVERLSTDRCLPRALTVEEDGSLPCRVAEATLPQGACECTGEGRGSPSPELDDAVREELDSRGQCGIEGRPACADYCVCELSQSTGEGKTACQHDEDTSGAAPGYCYIDAERTGDSGAADPLGNPKLVESCPSGSQRMLRFVGEDTPQNGASTFMACFGASARQN